ncbi:MAG: DUF192 domain-containing protein [Candidatus Saccharimonadales bacterium]
MRNDVTKKTKSARKVLAIFAAAAVLIIFAVLSQSLLHHYKKAEVASYNKSATILQNRDNIPLYLGDQVLHVSIARLPQEQQRGLCCRDSLDTNSGMLFVYDKPGDYRFWMKDTRIPLDMYWINGEKSIVHIEENVRPESYPRSFGSPKPAQYVLETNARFAKKHNIKVGDKIRF